MLANKGSNVYGLYKQGLWYENDLLAAIQARQMGGVFVDVGAGYGNHTVFFALECAADQVIAVEPYTECFEILQANISNNDLGGGVDAHQAMIHPQWESAAATVTNRLVFTEHGDIPCFTLDGLLAGRDVAVIKIDVEAMGPAVLGTGAETLERCRPLVAIEAEPSEQPAVDGILLAVGYKCLGRYCATPTFLWASA